MKRILFLLLAIPLLTMLTLAPGCAKKEVDKDEDLPKGTFSKAGNKTAAVTRVALKAPLDGVIRGRVVLDGTKPTMLPIAKMAEHQDHAICLAGAELEKVDQRWLIGPDNGVANVVVSLRAPAGKYFELSDELKKRTDKVVIDQPHCAFMPHVAAAFPSYFDGKDLQPTGQQFVVKNSAPTKHNTNWKGDSLKTGGGNESIPPKGELPIKLVPESNPIQLACDIHPWMTARVWAFDHPFFAVTKEDGTFEIKNVPSGIEVGLVAWHEVPGFLQGGKEGTKQKFDPGENKLPDLTISAK